jgi:hypothetical protein
MPLRVIYTVSWFCQHHLILISRCDTLDRPKAAGIIWKREHPSLSLKDKEISYGWPFLNKLWLLQHAVKDISS